MLDLIQYDMQNLLNQLMIKILEQKIKDLSQGQEEPSSSSSTTSYEQADGEFSTIINQVSSKYGVDPTLVESVIQAESSFRSDAVSSCGAMGLMQLMPGTADSLGVEDPFDPYQNIDGGVRYLKNMLDRYDGNVEKALAAYNAGPGAVDKYGGIPPYQETQTYVDRVMNNWYK